MPIKIRRKQPSGEWIRRSVALIASCNDGGNTRVVPLFAVIHVFNRKAHFGNFRRKIDLRKMHEIFKSIFKFERIAFIERCDNGGFDAVVRFVKIALFQIDVSVQNDDIIFRFGKFDRKRFSDTDNIFFPFPEPTDCGEGN